jgi:hypothetical protein
MATLEQRTQERAQKIAEKRANPSGARLPKKKTKSEIRRINACYDVNVEAYAELELDELKEVDETTLTGTKLAAFKDTVFYKTIEKMQEDAQKEEEEAKKEEETAVEVEPSAESKES